MRGRFATVRLESGCEMLTLLRCEVLLIKNIIRLLFPTGRTQSVYFVTFECFVTLHIGDREISGRIKINS